MGRVLGLRDINPNMWPSSPERSGVFVNLARATAPTVRPDARALEEGDIYWDSTSDILYVRDGASAWVSVGATGAAVTLTGAYNNGAGVLTVGTDPIAIGDANATAVNTLVINKTAAGSGNLIDINMTTTFSGDAINIAMTNASTAAQAMVIASQASVRVTNPLVDISELGTGAVPTLEVSGDAATTGPLFRINASAAVAPVAGTDGMQTILMTNAAAATEGLFIDGANASRTGACLGITDAGTTTGQLIRLVQTDTSSANAIEYTCSGAVTGDALNITMTNAGASAQAIVVVGAAATTSNLVSISHPGTGGGNALAITASSTLTGDLLDLSVSGAITGDFLAITMTNANNAADGITMTGSPTGRTGRMILVTDGQTTGTGASLEINSTGAKQGNHIIVNVDSVATAAGLHMDYDGAATGPVFNIDLDATGSGIVFDIDIATSVWTGDIFNFNSTQAYAGDIFDIVLTNCAAGVRALFITGSATTRTAHLIEIAEVGTPSGDVINISHGGASTGDCIHMVMTNAVAARCLNLDGAGTRTVNVIDIDCTGADTAAGIAIDTQAVGASGVATALAINQTVGAPVAGADIMRINNTAVLSSTSNVLALETNAGTAGSFALYISATSTAEAIKVDDGTVTFDETLTVTGQTTMTGGFNLTASTGVIKSATVTLTNANMLNLRATPIEVIPAVGAGDTVLILGGYLIFNYTGAYTESADNMELRFNNTTGTIISGVIEATGFVDATADAFIPIPVVPTAVGLTVTAGELSNPSVVIMNTGSGEYGGGNAANTVTVVVYYSEITTGL